jgi:PIN domain nuclease of toxin-antitoxin system
LRPRLLLDTHVIVRWLFEQKKLSREQTRALEGAVRQGEPLALSAVTLTEIALLVGEGHLELSARLKEFFSDLAANPIFRLLPLTYEIATDFALLAVLKDPADRVIAATARVHRLDLVTSDTRIIKSNLVPVIE